MEQPSSTPPRSKFKRTLTPFLAREMLYDFVCGQMDPERKAAVAACLESDRETKETLEDIRAGLACAEALAKTRPSPELLAALERAESAASLGRRYSRWSNWPETLRWSIVALGTSAAAAAAISFAPWRYLNEKGAPANLVVLAPIPANQTNKVDEVVAANPPPGSADAGNEAAASGAETQVAERSGDEEEIPLAAAPPQAVAEPPPSLAPHSAPSFAANPPSIAAQSPQPGARQSGLVAKNPPPAPPAIPSQATDAEGEGSDANVESRSEKPVASSGEKADGEKSERREGKPKGFVYRAWLSTSNVEESTPKIVDAIRELGGEKAGEVELGWRRGAGSYFHFTLPEKNEQETLDRLKAYGRVRISKDPHPRVMPQGQVRFILWVEADHSR